MWTLPHLGRVDFPTFFGKNFQNLKPGAEELDDLPNDVVTTTINLYWGW